MLSFLQTVSMPHQNVISDILEVIQLEKNKSNIPLKKKKNGIKYSGQLLNLDLFDFVKSQINKNKCK